MSDPTRSSRVALRAVAGLAALALVVGLAGCSSEPERNAEGEIEEEGNLSAFSLQEGDCLTDLASLGTTVQELPVVPWWEQGDQEVVCIAVTSSGDTTDGSEVPADDTSSTEATG
jgi:hypothetical protein